MTDYEKERWMRIQKNKEKMEELGIKSLAYEAMCLKEQKRQKVNNIKSNRVFANNIECRTDEDCELDQSNKENYNTSMQTRRSLRVPTTKVMVTGRNNVRSIEKPQFPTNSMVMATGRNNARSIEKPQFPTNSMAMGDKEGNSIKSNTLAKKGRKKAFIRPGSLGTYVMMREKLKEKEQISKMNVVLEEPILTMDQTMESSWKQQASYSQMQQLGLDENDEGSESSDDYVFQEENNAAHVQLENEIVEIRNESIPMQDQQANQQVCTAPPKKKGTRGPSMCKDVHGWTINDRKLIILNEKGDPIGPDNKTLDKFSRFLGTLARDSTLAPLNKLNWHRVPGKDLIWDYVKMKYIIAEEGKEYVLKNIGRLWSCQKSRLKAKHYKPYNNVDDIWKNKPSSIPDSHFKELIDYWDLDVVQELSEKNKERSEAQTDRHTMGPVSFARKKHELEIANKEPSSQALLYKETRKRDAEKQYKTSYEPIGHNIYQMEEQTKKQVDGDEAFFEVMKKPGSGNCRVLGRRTNLAKRPSKSAIIVPDEFLQPYKAQIVKETVAEVIKVLGSHLSPKKLASIATSFGDPLINKEPSGGINSTEQYQGDLIKAAGMNRNYDLEGYEERIENEEQNDEE